jgi:hypothetical protein
MRAEFVLVLGVSLAGIPPVAAQSQEKGQAAGSVTEPAGGHYRAGWLHRFFLGNHYRDLWTAPVEAQVLDLDTVAGGLHPTKRGGGQQTRSLRFKSADGREFAFRSVDKDPSSILPPELRGTVVNRVVQDQISAGHPGAPFVVAPLLEAAGVLHAEPQLVVLRDGDPRLGKFEADFGGMLGVLEERPEADDEDEAGFAGASEVIGTDKMEKRVSRGPANLVDARAFLAARLVDVYLGDWDRHRDQWRWARFGDEKPVRWVPIPRDRDQAFAKYDGLLLTIARGTAPQLVKFGPHYPGMLGLTWNGRDLDRRHLVGLEWPVWDSIATELQSRLTNEAIESAVAHLPAAYIPLDSARLASALEARRDDLRKGARSYYRHLAGEVDVHATDVPEIVTVEKVGHGLTDLSIATSDAPGQPYFHRRFDRKETNEVRLYVQPDDSVAITGSGGPRIRVVGNGGPDDKPYAPADTAIRDWGNRYLSQFWFSSGPDIGVFLGGGLVYTRYGFRKDPFAHRYRLRAGYATGASTIRADFNGEWHLTNSPVTFNVLARASGLDVVRFHGFGNETSAAGPDEFFRVNQIDYLLAPSIGFPLARHLDLQAGPRFHYSSTNFDQNRLISLARPYGSGDFGAASLGGDLRFDTRDRSHAATRGVLVTAGGDYFPSIFDVESDFGEVHGMAATYLTADSFPLQPTLALRVGGKKVWGTFPFQESAFIGDVSTVRLGRQNRYAGDAALYAGAELRLFLTKFFLLVPGDFGIFGLGDVGRVYLDGESSDRWHGAAGGGIWFAFIDRANTVSLALARGEERTGFYMQAGFGF